MNEEITDLKLKQLEESINNVSAKLEKLPEEITEKVNESVSLKIQVATKDLEMRFFKWVVGLLIGIASSLVGVVLNFVIR